MKHLAKSAALIFLSGAVAPLAHTADVDTYTPASSTVYGQGTLQAESPLLVGEGFSGGILAAFSDSPVVRNFDNGQQQEAVSAMLPFNLYGGYTLGETARIDAFLPVYGFVDAPINNFSGPAMGDLRLQGVVPLWAMDEVLNLGVVPRIGLPTGNRSAATFTGIAASLDLAASGIVPDLPLGWVANLGISAAPGSDLEGVGLGSSFDVTGGAWWQASESFRLGGELDLLAGLVQGNAGGNATSTGHIFAQQVLPSGLAMNLGAGTGLIAGLGAPSYRVTFGVSYAQLVRDADKDGIPDEEDGCIDNPEDFDGFQDEDGCPELDNDMDGIEDLTDNCPNDPEDLDGYDDADGCPDPDNDADGVLDVDDRCPMDEGTASNGGCPDSDGDGLVDLDDECPDESGPAETNGCPDRDEDLVSDVEDGCPDDAGPLDERTDLKDGCPKNAYVTAGAIRILQRVEFQTNSARIRAQSFGILEEVSSLMLRHPEIRSIEVQGHTDNVGRAEYNLKLSDRRAKSVRDFLIGTGVEGERLSPKGFGQEVPLDTNRTDNGRKNNRRVEFSILEVDASLLGTTVEEEAEVPKPQPVVQPRPTVNPNMDPNGEPGRLTVVVSGGQWANVYVDGQRLAKGAPFADLKVPAGRHVIWVSNEGAGIDYTETVTIENDEMVRIVVPNPTEMPEPSDTIDEEDDIWDLPEEGEDLLDSPWGDAEQVEEVPADQRGGRRGDKR